MRTGTLTGPAILYFHFDIPDDLRSIGLSKLACYLSKGHAIAHFGDDD